MSSQFTLLEQRRFLPFFLTQFAGAFNDNFYKNALVVLMTFQAAQFTTLAPGVLVNLAAGLFILPFFLFSATSGQLADKYEKSRLIRFTKLLEIGIMVLAAVAFALKSLPLMLSTLFLMGTQSSIFGPVKYAILPQHLKEDEIVGGNALVESGTFVSILLGTIAGGLTIALPGGSGWVSGGAIVIAMLGYVASRGIPEAPAADPGLKVDWNPITETWRNIGETRGNRTVFLSILGISWFWFYGAMFLSQFPGYAREVLGGDEHAVTLLLAVFSVGIGIGSLLCEKLSGRHVEIGLVPFGSIGLTLFGLDLWWASPATVAATAASAAPLSIGALLSEPASWRVLFDLVMIGVFGGFFIVPLYALIQTRSEPARRSRIIAGNNILNAAFMVVAAGLGAGLLAAGASIPQLILVTALLNAGVAIYIYTLVPEFLLRFIVWLLVHTVYRLKVVGDENIPEEGPAVIVANHVSFADALIIMAGSRRPIRFVMDHHIFRWPILSFVFRNSRAIPIAPAKEDPAMMERAFDEVAAALEAGELVGLFPEGRITDNGELYPFRPGIRRIVERTPVPVVPVALRGLWGSTFSRKGGPALSRPLRRGIFNRVELVSAPPLPPAEATPERLQGIVAGLRGEMR
ncbi:MAG: MFS transporter [Rhodocyclaceae bacterium]|nr:MFS transporter [Rhodocyclaceae bacterium]MCP5232275.1 MFS transporter [Zoogloeaceae bacterium]MCP5241517.1 MFS transporter [Zoogloeaceae bacterium]MCP5256062.1 MFS transporter [Zoogloeaceae bacterium]MCW5615924.1 MFS transporter [Rhodocyclaceae bacterium]